MKTSGLLTLIILIVAGAVIFFTLHDQQSPEEYIREVEAARTTKDQYMKDNTASPLHGVADFQRLTYFPVDGKFRVIADLRLIEEKKMVVLQTSDGKESRFIEYGFAEFQLDTADCRLLILEVADDGPTRGALYLAFADQTSGTETYGAGRYLDVKKVAGAASVELDFNSAYNPYCAYADQYSCPLPPKENILQVAIRAGEKNYH